MATTHIVGVKTNVQGVYTYNTSDKIETIVDNKLNVDGEKVLKTVIHKTINTTLNCKFKTACKEFEYIKKMHNDNINNRNINNKNEHLSFSLRQSFDGKIDPKIANEIGLKFAETFLNKYQCVISTHTNTDNTHNHILFNAWQIVGGKKYHMCNKTYAEIRKISDEICKEYGLQILKDTVDFKLIKYKDVNGKTKFFEPTERKKNMRTKEFSNANDYRNTDIYKFNVNIKDSNKKTIANDINKLIYEVKDFQGLLYKLRDKGYVIKSKRKDGSWRKYISYKAPKQEKFTRDYMISGDNYTRQSLENMINNINEMKKEINNDFSNEDIININSNFKNFIDKLDNIKKTALEKVVIKDTKNIYKEILKESESSENKRTNYLLKNINSNLKTLKFVEEKKINSFDDIIKNVNRLKENKKIINSELEKIKNAIDEATNILSTVDKYNNLINVIEVNSKDENYVKFDLEDDKNLLETYALIINENKIETVEKQEIFRAKYMNFENEYEKIYDALRNIDIELKDYEFCVENIKYIDKKYENLYEFDIKKYEILTGKQNTNNNINNEKNNFKESKKENDIDR